LRDSASALCPSRLASTCDGAKGRRKLLSALLLALGLLSCDTVDQEALPIPPVDALVASFVQTPQCGDTTITFTFTETYTGDVDSLTWEFGDGQTSTDLKPTHRYTTPGTYAATLTVIGPLGEDSYSRNVRVVSTLPGAPTITSPRDNESVGPCIGPWTFRWNGDVPNAEAFQIDIGFFYFNDAPLIFCSDGRVGDAVVPSSQTAYSYYSPKVPSCVDNRGNTLSPYRDGSFSISSGRVGCAGTNEWSVPRSVSFRCDP